MPLEGVGTGEQGREVGAIEMDATRFVDADQSAEGRKEVHGSSRFVLDAATGNPAFPVEDARDSVPTFELRSFLTAQFSVAFLPVAAVVGGVDDDGVVELAKFFEPGDEAPNRPVRVVDRAAVDRGLIVEIAILGNDLVGRRDRGVGFVEPEIEKEGFVGVAFFIKPGEGLVRSSLSSCRRVLHCG